MSTDNESGIVKPEVMRERALFYLESRGQSVDHVEMAKAGLGYDQRQKAEQQRDRDVEKVRNELDTFRWIRTLIQNVEV